MVKVGDRSIGVRSVRTKPVSATWTGARVFVLSEVWLFAFGGTVPQGSPHSRGAALRFGVPDTRRPITHPNHDFQDFWSRHPITISLL